MHVCPQYLDGQEVDVDLIFDNGVPAYGAVTVSANYNSHSHTPQMQGCHFCDVLSQSVCTSRAIVANVLFTHVHTKGAVVLMMALG